MLEVVRANEGAEFLSFFPQWKGTCLLLLLVLLVLVVLFCCGVCCINLSFLELYNHLRLRYDELCHSIELQWQAISQNEDAMKNDKAFAALVNKTVDSFIGGIHEAL